MPTNVTPIIGLYPGFHVWGRWEIYTGPTGTGLYVPCVNDQVFDWALGYFRVTDVDLTTNLATMVAVNITQISGGINGADLLLGTGPGTPSESYRIYVNTTTVPHQCSFDPRQRIYGVGAAYVKIFSGTDISGNGHVISAVYGTSGNITSENIPLQLLEVPNATNYAVKAPAQAYVTTAVANGDMVTVVVYGNDGAVLGNYRMLVVNTNFVRLINAAQKIISAVSLVSPYISATNANQLVVPQNVTLDAIPMSGQVTYTDGSTLTLPIDNTKFSLLGKNAYTTMELGKVGNLMLSYAMAPDESALVSVGPNPGRVVQELYTITAVAAIGTYSVKLFVIPVWDTVNLVWTLQYVLYNLDRNSRYIVTNQVEVGATSPTFNGALIGVTQQLTVAINLQNVPGAAFGDFRAVCTFSILLESAVTVTPRNNYWQIGYGNRTYGASTFAAVSADPSNTGLFQYTLASGLSTVSDWLAAAYTNSVPLYDASAEPSAPAPNYVTVAYGSGPSAWQIDIPIAKVLQPISAVPLNAPAGATVSVYFINRRTGHADQQLAVAPMSVN